MKIRKISIISLMIFLMLSLTAYSVISTAAREEQSEDNEIPSSVPPVGVEYIRDPFPIPRRNIVFIIRSDQGLQETNYKVTYSYDGNTIDYDEGSIIANPIGTDMSLELPYYGFFKQGKINVRLWNDDPDNHFDWSFPAHTLGIFHYVCLF